MKYDFRLGTDGAERFLSWLEQESTESLARALGSVEALDSANFLFANRACEAHMPDDQIAAVFARSLVRAGWPETNEAQAFDLLELHVSLARLVNGVQTDGP